MKSFIAIAALAIASFVNAQSPAFTSCATGTTDMTVTGFSLSPYPLCIGQNVCATITGSLSAPVDGPGATLAVTGKYLGRVVYTDGMDLCSVVSCPVAIDTTSITACILVKTTAPANIPVILQITATNGSGNTLFCEQATVTAVNC